MADFGFSALVTLSLVLLCIVSWFAYRTSPEDRHATFLWLLGSLSLAAASTFYALRPAVPGLVDASVFFTNFFLCLGVGLHVMGLIRIDDPDRLWWVFWIPGVIASMLGAWVLQFPWGTHVQPVLVASGLLVWIARAVFWILSHRWKERSPAMRRVLGFYLFAALAAIVFGARVEWMSLLPRAIVPQFSIGLTASVLLFLDLSLLSLGFGELLLIHDLSALRYRREAEFKLKAMIDLEEYRRLQKTLVDRERDVALGRMVATVNHSLNSPLAALVSANSMLGQVIEDQLPAIVFSLRTLTPEDWWKVARIARAMRPMNTEPRRRRRAALSQWLKANGLPDEPDSLVDVGIDLREELLDELAASSNPAVMFRLLVVWADSLTARTVVDLATRKASKLLSSLRDWFETGYSAESGPGPVSAALNSRVEVLRHEYPDLNVTVAFEAVGSVSPPLRPLERVFQAVLENAAFAAGTRGTVTARSFDHDGGVTIEIEDDGPGVSAGKQQYLFEPFVGASVESQSLGVSLYFCRLFLGEWGGSISYQREHGRTRFTIALPAQSESSESARSTTL